VREAEAFQERSQETERLRAMIGGICEDHVVCRGTLLQMGNQVQWMAGRETDSLFCTLEFCRHPENIPKRLR